MGSTTSCTLSRTPETCATLRVIPPRSCGTPFWTTAPTTATFTIWLKAPISTRRRPTRRPPATASAPSTLPGTAKFISPAPFPIRIWIFRYFFSISHHLTFAYLFPFSFFPPPPPPPSVSQSVTQPVLCFLFFVAIRKKEKKKKKGKKPQMKKKKKKKKKKKSTCVDTTA